MIGSEHFTNMGMYCIRTISKVSPSLNEYFDPYVGSCIISEKQYFEDLNLQKEGLALLKSSPYIDSDEEIYNWAMEVIDFPDDDGEFIPSICFRLVKSFC